MYDYVVIGSGYGGVATAALLIKQGFSVLILESHIAIGGCASFFKRKGFTFDAGATTLSGLLDHQPLGKLFNQLNINPNVKKLDPGMVVFLKDKKIIRYADKNQWINETNKKFNINQTRFWNEIYNIESKAWDLIGNNYKLPPRSISDLLSLTKLSNFKHVDLLPGLIKPLKHLLKKYKLDKNIDFKNFIDEQLLISTQNKSDLAPYLTSAIGLAYPSETYYPYGGIYKPLELVLEYFKSGGGEIKFKEKVINIDQEQGFYKISTEKGHTYQAKGVISNIPIWNMKNITNGYIKDYFNEASKDFKTSWGAFTLYFAVEDNLDLETAYYQLHTKNQLPHVNSKSIFVSFSLKDDLEKSPKCWRTVTISTHTKTDEWENISKEEYDMRKDELENAILEEFNYFFPELSLKPKMYINSGTPKTFDFYTGRYRGFVGGIPHTIKKNILSLTPNKTPFENFYLVGDTVFPGQGIPSVVVGSLNIIQRIKDEGIRPITNNKVSLIY